MIDLGKYPHCRDCVNYDTSRFPEECGKLAICRENKSGMHKVGYYSLGCEFFKEKGKVLTEQNGRLVNLEKQREWAEEVIDNLIGIEDSCNGAELDPVIGIKDCDIKAVRGYLDEINAVVGQYL